MKAMLIEKGARVSLDFVTLSKVKLGTFLDNYPIFGTFLKIKRRRHMIRSQKWKEKFLMMLEKCSRPPQKLPDGYDERQKESEGHLD